MAEFKEVMKQFDRMCWHYQQKHECPMACPMNGVNISQCRKIAFEEPEVMEKTVMAWAAEHPEPVYPTWAEWLISMGLIEYKASFENVWHGDCNVTNGIIKALNAKAEQRIPADTAEKLGLQPKEG